MDLVIETINGNADTLRNEVKIDSDFKYDWIEEEGFDGVTLLVLVITCPTGVAIVNAIKSVIINLIHRNDVKSVKIGDIELKGYSDKQVKELMESLEKK